MFLTTKSFFTIFFISVLLLSFGTFAEANGDEEERVIEFIGEPEIGAFTLYRMTEDIRTGKRRWIDACPEVTVAVVVDAYGIGDGQGTLKNLTFLGKTYEVRGGYTIEVGKRGIYEEGPNKGKGWYNKGTKGTDNTTVRAIISRRLKEMPVSELKDSWDWASEGSITLTPMKYDKGANYSVRWAFPLQISESFGTTGTWVPGKDIPRSAPKGKHGVHAVTLTPVDSLSVSLNKQMFTSDETLVATIQMEGITKAHLQFEGIMAPFVLGSSPDASDTITISTGFSDLLFQTFEWYGFVQISISFTKDDGSTGYANVDRYIGVKEADPLSVSFNKTTFRSDETLDVTVRREGLSSVSLKFAGQIPILDTTPDSPGMIQISSGFSGLDFSSSNEWYGQVIVTAHYDSNGTTKSEKVTQYITVDKVGYFENGDSFSAYSEYNAEVFDTEGILRCYWYVAEPGKKLKIKAKETENGRKSSSFSYPIDSKSKTGEYKVRAKVFYHGDSEVDITYDSSFTVF